MTHNTPVLSPPAHPGIPHDTAALPEIEKEPLECEIFTAHEFIPWLTAEIEQAKELVALNFMAFFLVGEGDALYERLLAKRKEMPEVPITLAISKMSLS